MRRMFELPEEDVDCLAANGYDWEAIIEGGTKWLVIPNYPIPEPYNHEVATVALRIQPSYPDVEIDMAYFSPPLALKSGKTIGGLSNLQLDNQAYQQWSRHRTGANPWRPGIDNVCTHLIQVDSWLDRELQ